MSKAAAVVGLVISIGLVALVATPSFSGYPWSFRFHRVAWLPGVSAVISWDAQRAALRDYNNGRHLLFGFGESGSQIHVKDCEVLYLRNEHIDRSVVPRWANAGLVGNATLACDEQIEASTATFTLVELGCIPADVVYQYGTEYNKRIIAVSRIASLGG